MIYTRRTNCDSLQVFQSIISIFEIYNLCIREKANNFLFFKWQKSKQNLFFGKTVFFSPETWKARFFALFFFAKQFREKKWISHWNQIIADRTAAIFLVQRKFVLSQFFWSEENSISRNSFSRTKLVHLKCIDRWLWCSVTIGHQFHCQESNSNYA